MNEIKLLDHGYIKLIEVWGSDERIVEAARQSTDGAFRGWGPNYKCRTCGCLWRNNHDDTISLFDMYQKSCTDCEGKTLDCSDEVPGDEKLLSYLYNNNHSTPFEMAGCIIEVQAPILVFREWQRHRTQSFSELSARYTPLPDLYYMPTLERVMINSSGSNKQAGRIAGADELTEGSARAFLALLEQDYARAEEAYQGALRVGVPKELARCIMPVGHYSRMRASANLRNWLGFMTLRSAENAQWEIRQYSDALNGMLAEKFPRTMELFNK